MTTINEPAHEFRVDELVERICAEAVARRGLVVAAGRSARATLASALQKRDAHDSARDRRFTVGDFLSLQDIDFIDAAYRAVLRRRADAGGAQHFLDGLRSGAMSKVEVLGRLRYSREGRSLAVPVAGLARAFVIANLRRFTLAIARRLGLRRGA